MTTSTQKTDSVVDMDSSRMIAGLSAKSGMNLNKLIQALMTFKLTANELEKDTNKNTMVYGQGQADAEKDYYESLSRATKFDGIMKATQAGVQVASLGAGMAMSRSSNKANQEVLDAHDAAKNQKTDAIKVELKENASAVPKAPTPPTAAEVEAAHKGMADNRTNAMNFTQRIGDTACKGLEAADSFKKAAEEAEQAQHKADEALYQSANQINNNVAKGLETQKDTASSSIQSAMEANMRLVQANTHQKA